MLMLVPGLQMIGGSMREVLMYIVNLMKHVRNYYPFCLQMMPQYVTLYLKERYLQTWLHPSLINGTVLIKYGTVHVQVYKKRVQFFVTRKILKITHMLGSYDTRNTLLVSDYCHVVNAREQLLSCTLVLASNN